MGYLLVKIPLVGDFFFPGLGLFVVLFITVLELNNEMNYKIIIICYIFLIVIEDILLIIIIIVDS
jgi:hypothetical protein